MTKSLLIFWRKVVKKLRVTYIDFLLVLVTLIWGSNPMTMKIGIKYIPPLAFNAIRLMIASIVCVMILKFSKSYVRFNREDLKELIPISIFGFFMFQISLTLGVSMTTAANASIIMATLPVNVVLINKIFKIENVTMSMLLGVMCSIIGVIILILGSGESISISMNNIIGGILVLISQLTYAYYTVFSKRLLQKYSSYQVTAFIIMLTTVIFLIISIKDIASINWATIPIEGWLSEVYSGVFVICLGNFVWIWAVRKIGSTRTSMYNNLTPIFGVILGCIFLGESFGLVQVLGAIIVFWGLYLTKQKKKEK